MPSWSTIRSQLVLSGGGIGFGAGGNGGRPGKNLDVGRPGPPQLDLHTLPKLPECLNVRPPQDESEVGLGVAEVWVRQPVKGLAIIHEDQQALAVEVQAAGRLKVGRNPH